MVPASPPSVVIRPGLSMRRRAAGTPARLYGTRYLNATHGVAHKERRYNGWRVRQAGWRISFEGAPAYESLRNSENNSR